MHSETTLVFQFFVTTLTLRLVGNEEGFDDCHYREEGPDEGNAGATANRVPLFVEVGVQMNHFDLSI